MKTNQIMVSKDRELMGFIVEQRTKDSFFNLTDFIKCGNRWRFKNGYDTPLNFSAYLNQKGTKELILELEKEYGTAIVKSKNKNQKTWGHPFLFLDLALSINPKLKVQVYKWLFDYLIQYRCDSGDSYKRMCGAIFQYTTQKTEFHKNIAKLANFIKKECGVTDWNNATQEQLKLRDKYQDNIAGMVSTLKNTRQGVDLGVHLTREQIKNS